EPPVVEQELLVPAKRQLPRREPDVARRRERDRHDDEDRAGKKQKQRCGKESARAHAVPRFLVAMRPIRRFTLRSSHCSGRIASRPPISSSTASIEAFGKLKVCMTSW